MKLASEDCIGTAVFTVALLMFAGQAIATNQGTGPDRRECVKLERKGSGNAESLRFSTTCPRQLSVAYCLDKGVAPVCGKGAYRINLGAPVTINLGVARRGAQVRYAACDWNKTAFLPGSHKFWDGAGDAYECR